MYDIIGDIHGYAAPLCDLLLQMGYRRQGAGFVHPGRKVIFVGDYIDRGPDQVAVYQIVRTMVEAGQAIALMGNHELNAVLWCTEDPLKAGHYLRPHAGHNLKQHQEFLQQVGENSSLHAEMIHWFKSLPLWFEDADIRVVHACWHADAITYLQQHQIVNAQQVIASDTAWQAVGSRQHPAFMHTEYLLKGIELNLPEGFSFLDKDGKQRFNARVRWWLDKTVNRFAELALIGSQPAHHLAQAIAPDFSRYEDHKPLFVGHYWLSGKPEILSAHVACLDYSIAKAAAGDARLCAYRYQGETQLSGDHLTYVQLS